MNDQLKRKIAARKVQLTRQREAESLVVDFVHLIERNPSALYVTNRDPGRERALDVLTRARAFVAELNGQKG